MTDAATSVPPHADAPGRTDPRLVRLLAIVIIGAGLAVYANAVGAAFVFDDVPRIIDRADEFAVSTSALLRGDRRPVVTATLALNHAVGGLDPRGYHALNILLHLTAALVLFALVRDVILPRRGATPIAFATALLWVVHPLQTESVTYVIQRAEVLAGLAMLLVLYAVQRFAHGRQVGWAIVAVVTCLLGMGSKATMVVAPPLALLFDGLVVSSSWREALRRRWGLHLALACTWIALLPTGVLGALLGSPADAGAPAVGFGVVGVTPVEYLASQPGVIAHYLGLAVWPRVLCIDYGWGVAGTAASIVPAAVLLGLALLVVAIGVVRRHRLAFAGAAFFMWLAPTSSIVPIRDLATEHRMYLPLAALVLVAVTALWGLGCRGLGEGRTIAVGGALLVAVAVVLGARTIDRNRDYRTPVALWSATVAQVPENRRARLNLGVALNEAGRTDEALVLLEEAVRERPGNVVARLNLGSALANAERYDEAIVYLSYAAPMLRRPDALLHLGDTLRRAGRPDEAVDVYRRVQESAASAGVCLALGNACTEAGRLDEAVAAFEEGARLARADEDDVLLASALYNLGNAHFRAGAMEEATAAYRAALEASPDHAGARRWLADVEARRERER